jgi:hypothetical protein
MNAAVLLLSACTVGADPSVVQASGWSKGGDCCGKAVVVDNCTPKCGCGLFSKLKNLCSKSACDTCPKAAPACTPCPKPAPVCNPCEKAAAPCDPCATKKKHCGLFSCLNFHINLCHGCDKGHKSHKGCDTGCGTTVVAPAAPAPAAVPVPAPAPKPDAKVMPKVGSHYNPAERAEIVPVITQSNGKIIIDVVPQK